jgi:hypothetical protein
VNEVKKERKEGRKERKTNLLIARTSEIWQRFGPLCHVMTHLRLRKRESRERSERHRVTVIVIIIIIIIELNDL